ncbi:uncharacterized protein MONBRDRAFT_18222 [Monosiga brevicollis MX1]|uniref:UDP-glucose 4-epimerase n=1 Tax=Monosiga brevicollis TaxID=81824 RepID=A9UV21_MONBE|nr:uncharacterized protein MONBRDRAFT_18222 [Monosiga brevicollis MX1]EDQ90816.1 predicted protein [Monosiga brevicollis MX1]|eukprot:XP_001744113.1 hypothetical protein [Monosiga brevicollis MX1]
MARKILVTGGAGYIGTHTCIELIAAGFEVIIVDNLINASRVAVERVEEIVGQKITFLEIDLLDKEAIDKVFAEHEFFAVIHFAGLKAVGESTQKPWLYYHNNITGTLNLLDSMKQHKCFNLVFSSSATVYGDPKYLPLDEKHPVGACTNPYGKTKYFIEEMCRDMAKADSQWNIVLLRYFNPIGAHASGRIGEDPQGIPNNLLPFVAQVAAGRRPHVNVFGDDYDTPDGTGVRDYIHVVDLALGHVASLRKLEKPCGCVVYNLGTGKGVSVLEMIKAFGKAAGRDIPYQIAPRRPGDIASCYADASAAKKDLDWVATRTVEQACEDSWRWQSNNPNGFNA